MALKTPITDQATVDPFGHYAGLPKSGVVLASGDFHTTDPKPIEVVTPIGANNCAVVVSFSAQSGTTNTVTLNVERWDEAKQGWVAMFPVAPAMLSGGAYDCVIQFGSNIATSGTVAQNLVLPQVFRLRPVGTNTRTTLNYAIGAHFTS
jgi:hypothetical protein